MDVAGPVLVVPETGIATGWVVFTGVLMIVAVLGLVMFIRGGRWPSFRRGVTLGTRGLVAKELRSRSRGWRPALLLTGYLAALTLGVSGFLFLFGQASGIVSPAIGTHLFSTLSLGAVLLLAFITPALTAGAVSGERERRTLDLLLVTRASPLGLVTGKLIGSLVYILFLLVASLPAFALVYLFGGVPPRFLIMVILVAAVTALSHAALGLLLSAVFKRTLVALVISYLVVLALVIGLPFAAAVTGLAGRMQPWGMSPTAPAGEPAEGQSIVPPGVYLQATPLLSLASVLPDSSPDSTSVSGIIRQVLFGAGTLSVQPTSLPITQSLYIVGIDPVFGQPRTAVYWSPWVYHFIFSGAFTAFSLVVSALALAPIKPWWAWRARRRARAAPAMPSPT